MPTETAPADDQAQPLSSTARSTVHRNAKRAVTDRHRLYDVLDAALVCHMGIVVPGDGHAEEPLVLPTGFARNGRTLYLHGSSGARILRQARDAEVCVSVALLDGIVYSRAVFHCSMNYRSAVIHGRARVIDGMQEKLRALKVITERLAPGSWDYARLPNVKELAKTTVLTLDLAEAAVKVREGDPADEPEDIETSTAWAGVLPLHREFTAPVPSADLPPGTVTPAHVLRRVG